MPQPCLVCDLGPMGYREAWDLQTALQTRLIEAKRSEGPLAPEATPHVLLLVEHPPVFTLGKSGDRANLLADETTLNARGAAYVETDRGGDITFHGPGQIVAYPVLDLDRLHSPSGEPLRDLHRYLREMETAVIQTCADWGVMADRVPGRTGVWVGPDAQGDERKVCAMGVRCSRWVTMHGLALNVSTDLRWFDLIVPCGIDDRGVTTLAREAAGDAEAPVEIGAVRQRLVAHLADRLGLLPRRASRADIGAYATSGKISAASGAV